MKVTHCVPLCQPCELPCASQQPSPRRCALDQGKRHLLLLDGAVSQPSHSRLGPWTGWLQAAALWIPLPGWALCTIAPQTLLQGVNNGPWSGTFDSGINVSAYTVTTRHPKLPQSMWRTVPFVCPSGNKHSTPAAAWPGRCVAPATSSSTSNSLSAISNGSCSTHVTQASLLNSVPVSRSRRVNDTVITTEASSKSCAEMPCVSGTQREQVRCCAAMAHLRSAASRCHDIHAHLQRRDPSLVPLCACSRRAVDGGDRAAQHAQVILAVPWVGVACGGDAAHRIRWPTILLFRLKHGVMRT